MKRKSITLTIAFDDDQDAVIQLPESAVVGTTLPFVLPEASHRRAEVELSPELKLLSIDRLLAQALGRDSAELLDRPLTELLHSDDRMPLLSRIGQVAAGTASGPQPVQLLDASGQTVPAQLELEGRFESGRFVGLRAIIELKRKQPEASAAATNGTAAQQLRQLEERLRLTVDKAPVAICITDEHGHFESVNEAYCQLYGYRPEELIGKPFTLVVDPNEIEIWLERHRRFIENGREIRGQYRVYRKDGRMMHILADAARVFGLDGKPRKVTYVQDITDRLEIEHELQNRLSELKAQEEELRQNAEELEAAQEELRRANLLLEGQIAAIRASSLVAELDLQGRFISANQRLAEVFGFSDPQELAGLPHRQFVPPDYLEAEYEAFWQRLRQGEFSHGEYPRIDRSGRLHWLLGAYYPIRSTDGQPIKILKIATDITAQKQLVAETEEHRRELEAIFASAPVGISITNEQGEYTFVNQMFCTIHGYDQPEELLGKPFTMTVPAEHIEAAREAHRQAVARGDSGVAQTVGQTREGHLLNLIANWTCIHTRDGEPRVVTFLTDITQSKAEEERLRDLSLVASKTDNAVIIADHRGLIEWVNEGFERVTGYTLDEVKGRKPGSFLQGPETDPNTVRQLREAIAARRPITTEILNYTKAGVPYWLYLSITPVLDEKGELQKFIAIERDITEERVLADQLEQLSLVASKTSNAVIITDKFGAIQWVNDGFTNISGYTLDEVIGRKPGSFLQGPGTDPLTVQLIRKKLKGKESFTVEILNYTKQGKPYWLSLNITPILDEFGTTQRYIAIESDITERKAAESRLEELSLVASQTDNAVVITDRFGKTTWVNDGFTKISGYTLEEVLGKTPGEVLQGPGTDPETVRRIGQKLRARERVQEEILNYHKNGTPYWLYLNITPILDEHGDLVKFIALETDITERKVAEERLRQFNEQLQKTLKDLQSAQNQLLVSEKMAALGQLIAGIAHEVNTPISAVKSSARNVAQSLPELMERLPDLLQQLSPAEQKALRDFIQRALTADVTLTTKEERQARRSLTALFEQSGIARPDELAEKLVEIRIVDQVESLLPLFRSPLRDRILDTAYQLGQIKVNMGNIQIASEKTAKIITALKNYSHMQTSDQMTDISLIDNLETVLTLYSNQFKHGVRLERDFEQVPPMAAYADELGQVWTNIIQNAIQAMKGHGTLSVSVRQEGDEAVVRITDSGPGIPEHIRHRIFEPFFTTKPQGEGTGLGLDIVRKIVEKHNGRIEVDSEPGRTTFTVTLPIQSVGELNPA